MPADKLQDVAIEGLGLLPVDRVSGLGQHDELGAGDMGELAAHDPGRRLQVLISGHQQRRHANRRELVERDRRALRLCRRALLSRVVVNLQPDLADLRDWSPCSPCSLRETPAASCENPAATSSRATCSIPRRRWRRRWRRRPSCATAPDARARSHRPRSRRRPRRRDGNGRASDTPPARADHPRWCRAEARSPDSPCCGPSRADQKR